MPIQCVIFDLDGTLVDSEGLCNQAFLDLLPHLDDTVDTLTLRYRGLKLSNVLADLEDRTGAKLPTTFEESYRKRVADLFSSHLRPVTGVVEMLEALALPKCIASSGPRPKIEKALMVSGLLRFFGNRVFSSYEVGSWKPDPGLFLHSAAAMGFQPAQCAVVEDSTVGIKAAIAAGMTAFHFRPTADVPVFDGVVSFTQMSCLPTLLGISR